MAEKQKAPEQTKISTEQIDRLTTFLTSINVSAPDRMALIYRFQTQAAPRQKEVVDLLEATKGSVKWNKESINAITDFAFGASKTGMPTIVSGATINTLLMDAFSDFAEKRQANETKALGNALLFVVPKKIDAEISEGAVGKMTKEKKSRDKIGGYVTIELKFDEKAGTITLDRKMHPAI